MGGIGVAEHHRLLDEHLPDEADAEAAGDDRAELLDVVDNAAAGAFYRELAEKFPSSAFALQRGGYLLRKSLFDIQSPVRIEPAAEQK